MINKKEKRCERIKNKEKGKRKGEKEESHSILFFKQKRKLRNHWKANQKKLIQRERKQQAYQMMTWNRQKEYHFRYDDDDQKGTRSDLQSDVQNDVRSDVRKAQFRCGGEKELSLQAYQLSHHRPNLMPRPRYMQFPCSCLANKWRTFESGR